uniref:Uncharacterized protein n=1 Tax=Candidatus Kentrum sp. TUN TaxID=2126343 RepID=A0A450ZZ20_9GAMM|nr:MAG: hypothetical protein BECKTUN1418D_GA0071000_10943 [Candidatus Kentron sp. TUN]
MGFPVRSASREPGIPRPSQGGPIVSSGVEARPVPGGLGILQPGQHRRKDGPHRRTFFRDPVTDLELQPLPVFQIDAKRNLGVGLGPFDGLGVAGVAVQGFAPIEDNGRFQGP